ncbi:hypothetical protein [Microvirga sp. BSC39]|uniref:hypothetical protein n=1 Tax=Microvirga sp. BSC39 TaxID=1549810 RepID=UPI000AA7F3C0|nr:hypothetical protein [Microvirga sp. BSC39]
MPSSSDLKQIKEALRELRTSSPRSVLADLVDEKIRAIESPHPVPHFHSPATPARWIGH